MATVRGNHHFTSCAGGAQEDFDFHVRLLGLRLLKQTGLYEGRVPIYHLYYGNAEGDAGTVLTTFPVRQQGLRGQLGTDQIGRLNLSIPIEAVPFWVDRLRGAGIDAEVTEAHGLERIHFRHPSGLPHGLVADGYGDASRAWEQAGVPASHAILGNHGVTVRVSQLGPMRAYLEEGIGAVGDGSHRWRIGDPSLGRVGFVELVEDPNSPPGTQTLGEGTVHHCAWDVADQEVQEELREHLDDLGHDDWIGPRDRTYFVSLYNRTPGGALFEYAWSRPRLWTVDEPLEELGSHFFVPPSFASERTTYQARLEPINTELAAAP